MILSDNKRHQMNLANISRCSLFSLLIIGLQIIAETKSCSADNIREVLVGQAFEIDISVYKSKDQKIWLEPAGAAMIHLEKAAQASQSKRLIIVFQEPGLVRLHGLAGQHPQAFQVKAWPNPLPLGGVAAGVGEVDGAWLVQSETPKVGDIMRLSLKLKGNAALAIRQPPQVQVKSGDETNLAEFAGQVIRWPTAASPAEVFYWYDVALTNEGPCRVSPVLIHSWNEATKHVQTRLISGPGWSVAARPLFQAEVRQTSENQDAGHTIWWPLFGFVLIILIVVMMTMPWSFIIRWFDWLYLASGLGFMDQNPSPALAQQLYRKLEPVWLKFDQNDHKKCPPKWWAWVQTRMEILKRAAFGPARS